MNYKLIDLSSVTTKEELFDKIEDGLDLPVYFGRNLDALHDMLSHSDMVLEICGIDELKEALVQHGYELLYEETENDWVALVARRL